MKIRYKLAFAAILIQCVLILGFAADTETVAKSVITVGSYDYCDFVTDSVKDEVQLEAAFAAINETSKMPKVIRICSMLVCSRTPVINNTNGVPIIVEGINSLTGISVPQSANGLEIKNPSMVDSCILRNLLITGPDSAHLGSTGIDFIGKETDTNLIDVSIRYFSLGIDASSPSAYNCNLVRVNTNYCNNGIYIKGQNNLLDHCQTGYDMPGGTNIGFGLKVEGERSGNTLIACDSGESNKGIWLYHGAGNNIFSAWHDGSGYSLYIEGSMSNKVFGGFYPEGSTIFIDNNSSYNDLQGITEYNGKPTIVIDRAEYTTIEVSKTYDVGNPTYVTDNGVNTSFVRELSMSVTPQGNVGGRRGMVVWNLAAVARGSPGWVCVKTGTSTTAIWKPMANLSS
jgi:hypothetical protein